MPTPQDDTTDSSFLAPDLIGHLHWTQRPTCPPEEQRVNAPRHRGSDGASGRHLSAETQPTAPSDLDSPLAPDSPERPVSSPKPMEPAENGSMGDMMSPVSAVAEGRDGEHMSWPFGVTGPDGSQSATSLSTKNDFSRIRLSSTFSSSFLRTGSKFHGTQRSDRQVYDVQVELKHVDISQSFVCGYLRIQGLTEDHPTLTTYFEGEIIGDKYSFQTKHPEWGSNDKVDMQHWARFNAWRPLAKSAKRPDFSYKNFAQKEFMFMRWKEYFLVPDHRVRTISGASFEGFYYICFNQVKGVVSGIYFHAKSEK
ncbi:MAG: hypothetical protein M1837_005731 [Sclerophora amabilis]|nr:MAG: hypothetical protein M1837_005731 [Sclerophora amabilis]